MSNKNTAAKSETAVAAAVVAKADKPKLTKYFVKSPTHKCEPVMAVNAEAAAAKKAAEWKVSTDIITVILPADTATVKSAAAVASKFTIPNAQKVKLETAAKKAAVKTAKIEERAAAKVAAAKAKADKKVAKDAARAAKIEAKKNTPKAERKVKIMSDAAPLYGRTLGGVLRSWAAPSKPLKLSPIKMVELAKVWGLDVNMERAKLEHERANRAEKADIGNSLTDEQAKTLLTKLAKAEKLAKGC